MANPKNTAQELPNMPVAPADLSDRSDRSDKSDVSDEKETPLPEPVVEIHPQFHAGQTVRHANGAIYTVRLVHPEGIGLDHVANLVHPSALTPVAP